MARTVPGVAFAPKSWAQVGRSFDAEPATIRHRWHTVSPWMLGNPVFVGEP
jgi:hypothetical protein